MLGNVLRAVGVENVTIDLSFVKIVICSEISTLDCAHPNAILLQIEVCFAC